MRRERTRSTYSAVSVADFCTEDHINMNEDAMSKLNRSLLETFKMIKLSNEEIQLRKMIFKQFKDLIEKSLPSVKVEMFGSLQTGLMVFNSDIDVTILPSKNSSNSDLHNNSSNSDLHNNLDNLHNNSDNDFSKDLDGNFSNNKNNINLILLAVKKIITKFDFASGQIIHIKSAKVPILKIVDKVYGIKIDIGVNQSDGIETGKYIKSKLEEYPEIEPVVVLVKYFFKRRNLSKALNGGLVGYAQFLLILNFIQLHPLIQSNAISIKDNLGVLFMDFFQYYSQFPFNRAIIDVENVVYSFNPSSSSASINIKNPLPDNNTSSNVAHNCSSIGFIKDIFYYSYRLMRGVFLQPNISSKKKIVELWFKIDYSEFNKRKEIIIKFNKNQSKNEAIDKLK